MFPGFIAGLLLAAIVAAAMSTADSQLLAASSAFSENLLQDVFGIKLTAKQTMLVARLTVIAIAVIAVFLARDPNSSVFNIVSFAWAGFGASFGPAMLCALFWKRTTWQGALAGMLAGLLAQRLDAFDAAACAVSYMEAEYEYSYTVTNSTDGVVSVKRDA